MGILCHWQPFWSRKSAS